jgi:hypothetical protein
LAVHSLNNLAFPAPRLLCVFVGLSGHLVKGQWPNAAELHLAAVAPEQFWPAHC